MKYEDFITIGKIVKSIGIKGEVKVILLTDFPERFRKLKKAALYSEKSSKFIENKYTKDPYFPITSAVRQQDHLRLRIDKFDTKDLADELKDLYIMIEEKERVKLPQGQFYFYEVIGSEVYDNDELKGKVESVENYGSDDLFRVRTKENKEVFIPIRKEFVKKVDTKNKRVDTINFDDLLDQ